jgi:hypothetical protein
MNYSPCSITMRCKSMGGCFRVRLSSLLAEFAEDSLSAVLLRHRLCCRPDPLPQRTRPHHHDRRTKAENERLEFFVGPQAPPNFDPSGDVSDILRFVPMVRPRHCRPFASEMNDNLLNLLV